MMSDLVTINVNIPSFINGKDVIVNTSDADIVANDVVKDKIAYGANGKVVGTFEGVDTSDADAIAEDIVKDKTAYVGGVKVVGTHECSGGEIQFSDVMFWDFDGTVLYRYTKEEALALTEFPELHDRPDDGLVARGWNYTNFEDFIETVEDIGVADVGALYNTADGKTHFTLNAYRIPTETDEKPSLRICGNGSLTVDWGNDEDLVTVNLGTDDTYTYDNPYIVYVPYTTSGMYNVSIDTVDGSEIELDFKNLIDAYMLSCNPFYDPVNRCICKKVMIGNNIIGVYNCYADELILGQDILYAFPINAPVKIIPPSTHICYKKRSVMDDEYGEMFLQHTIMRKGNSYVSFTDVDTVAVCIPPNMVENADYEDTNRVHLSSIVGCNGYHRLIIPKINSLVSIDRECKYLDELDNDHSIGANDIYINTERILYAYFVRNVHGVNCYLGKNVKYFTLEDGSIIPNYIQMPDNLTETDFDDGAPQFNIGAYVSLSLKSRPKIRFMTQNPPIVKFKDVPYWPRHSISLFESESEYIYKDMWDISVPIGSGDAYRACEWLDGFTIVEEDTPEF